MFLFKVNFCCKSRNCFFQKAYRNLRNVTEEKSNIRFAYVTGKDMTKLDGKNNLIVRPPNGANMEVESVEQVSSLCEI